MLTQSLQINLNLGQLQVQPSRLDMQVLNADVFRDSELRVTPSRLTIAVSDPSTITINTRAIQEELGFRRPIQFMQYTLGRSRSGAASAISNNVRKGDLYLDSPSSATQTLSASAGVYSASTEIAVKPKNRPQINFSSPSEIESNYEEGSVEMIANSRFEISFNFQQARISLSQNPSVNIRLVNTPGAGRKLDFNA